MQKQITTTDMKIVYSFRIKTFLEMEGFEPLFETENPKDKRYKCWIFKSTPALERAFGEAVKGAN